MDATKGWFFKVEQGAALVNRGCESGRDDEPDGQEPGVADRM